jgi:hypothetical protein
VSGLLPIEKKKPETDFVVRLVRHDMRPWAVPMRSLAQILQATQRLVSQREDEEVEDGIVDEEEVQPAEPIADQQERQLRLVDVRAGSATYAVSAIKKAVAVSILAATGAAIAAPDQSDWSQATLSSLRDLSDVARRLDCRIEMRQPPQNRGLGEILAEVSGETFSAIQGSAFIRGHSSVIGSIQRVGGATAMHCALRLPNRTRLLICRVATPDLVRGLGQYLYQTIVVSGEATWLRQNWQLRGLRITAFEPPKTGSIREALEKIKQAGGHEWNNIADPLGFIAEMRGA